VNNSNFGRISHSYGSWRGVAHRVVSDQRS